MDDLKQAQRRRLRFIEFLLLFKGHCSRSDLVDRFSTSEPAATKDFSEYSDRCPGNLSYDVRAKKYIYGNTFKPAFDHSAETALHYLSGSQSSIGEGSQKECISSGFRVNLRTPLKWQQVAPITRAISQQRPVECGYTSMSSDNRMRSLSPHSIIFDGNRWHFRAFDHEKQRYQDYNFSRVTKLLPSGEVYVGFENDKMWNKKLTVQLIPHPKHPKPQAIIQEFPMKNDMISVRVRSALIGYFLRSWLVDFSENFAANYRAYQLALANREELLIELNQLGDNGYALKSDFLPEDATGVVTVLTS